MSEADKVVPLPGQGGAVQWADSFVNLLAGLGVEGRDKFASQAYVLQRMSSAELETAYRGDWISRKAVTIPAYDMTREWRDWQADPDQITLLEAAEKSLFIQQKLQDALIKARLYGGAAIILGVDVGNPEDELDLEKVGKDSLKFIHVVSRNQITVGPIIYDISSKYFGQPEYYEARNTPVDKSFQQAEASKNKAYAKNQVRLHPSRVVKLIGVDTADQMLSEVWGDSVLQAVNDAVKMCGLVSGSLATLVAELKVDVIKVPELKSILSTDAGTQKMLKRFSTANAAKSVINTILIDGNEEWQRITASLAGVPEVLVAYMQVASGAVDIPAGRFLGLPHRGLNVTGEADFRNYYDKLASEQKVVLTPAMTQLDEVLIRSTLGDHPPEVWYEWRSLWQLSESEKSAIALQKAQAYQIDVTAAQLPTTALANGRANQLIEDGFYPGLEQALDDAAAEGDTIEEHNKAPEMDPMMMANAAMAANGMDPTQPDPTAGKPPAKPFGAKPNPFAKGGSPFPPKKANFPPMKADGFEDDDVEDINTEHEPAGSPKGGRFAPKDDLPSVPGTTPIPDGHVRLYHQTGEDKLEAIREGGLKMENAKGIEGPRAIYAGETGFYGKPGAVPTVEFSVPKERWREPFVRADSVLDKGMVAPENIIAIHYPWHQHARYIEDHPDTLKNVLSGKHDDLLGDPGHAPAISYIKRKYGGTKDYNELHREAGDPEGGGRFAPKEGGAGGAGDLKHPGKGYSKDAYIDDKGVIQTTSVDDAALALSENRKVELDQPDKVSTLLDKLGAKADEMIAKGQKAPKFNLCNVSVKGTNLFCADSKGIERIKMPQISETATRQMVDQLKREGFKVEDVTIPASHMRATQNELNGAQVAGIAKSIRERGLNERRRIVVSKDNYIVDGHHRWAAKIGNDYRDGSLSAQTGMKVTKVHASITELLRRAGRYSGRKLSIGDLRQLDLLDYNERHRQAGDPEGGGRFAPKEGGAGGGSLEPHKTTIPTGEEEEKNAADLLQHDPNIKEGDILDRVPGGREYFDKARAQYDLGVPTDKTPAEGGRRNADGTWTPEARAEHKAILNGFFTPEKIAAATPAPGQKPLLDIYGGRGGSGKSFFNGKDGTVDASKSIHLDNDEFKAGLKSYAGWNAGLVHEEASHVTDRAEAIARKLGLNIIHDGTMKSAGSLSNRLDKYREAGYAINGHYMYTSPDKSAERALQRAVSGEARFQAGKATVGGRFVRPKYSLESTTNERSFDSVKSKMDNWEIYSNNIDGQKPQFVSRKRRS